MGVGEGVDPVDSDWPITSKVKAEERVPENLCDSVRWSWMGQGRIPDQSGLRDWQEETVCRRAGGWPGLQDHSLGIWGSRSRRQASLPMYLQTPCGATPLALVVAFRGQCLTLLSGLTRSLGPHASPSPPEEENPCHLQAPLLPCRGLQQALYTPSLCSVSP